MGWRLDPNPSKPCPIRPRPTPVTTDAPDARAKGLFFCFPRKRVLDAPDGRAYGAVDVLSRHRDRFSSPSPPPPDGARLNGR